MDSMWAKTYGNSMDFLKTFSMEDFRKGSLGFRLKDFFQLPHVWRKKLTPYVNASNPVYHITSAV